MAATGERPGRDGVSVDFLETASEPATPPNGAALALAPTTPCGHGGPTPARGDGGGTGGAGCTAGGWGLPPRRAAAPPGAVAALLAVLAAARRHGAEEGVIREVQAQLLACGQPCADGGAPAATRRLALPPPEYPCWAPASAPCTPPAPARRAEPVGVWGADPPFLGPVSQPGARVIVRAGVATNRYPSNVLSALSLRSEDVATLKAAVQLEPRLDAGAVAAALYALRSPLLLSGPTNSPTTGPTIGPTGGGGGGGGDDAGADERAHGELARRVASLGAALAPAGWAARLGTAFPPPGLYQQPDRWLAVATTADEAAALRSEPAFWQHTGPPPGAAAASAAAAAAVFGFCGGGGGGGSGIGGGGSPPTTIRELVSTALSDDPRTWSAPGPCLSLPRTGLASGDKPTAQQQQQQLRPGLGGTQQPQQAGGGGRRASTGGLDTYRVVL